MKMRIWAAILPLGVAANGPAPAPTQADFEIIREAQQLALVNTASPGEQEYSKGDAILDAPLVWEFAAKNAEPVSIATGDELKSLPSGTTLQAVILSKAGLPHTVHAYCTPRKATERKLDEGGWNGILQNFN